MIVEGSGVTMWVVHPKAGDPKLYERAFGPKWWKRRKKMLQKRKEAKEKRR